MSTQPNIKKPKRPSWFWWTLINLMALCFAVLSWTGCYYLFRFPERPGNYKLLSQLNRLPGHQFFDRKELPSGRLANPDDLYRDFDLLALRIQQPERSDVQILADINQDFLRNYINRFENSGEAIFLSGHYRIKAIRELTKNDFITSGYALLIQALKNTGNTEEPLYEPFPLELELILPTETGVSISPETRIASDNHFELKKLPYGFSLIHLSTNGTPDDPLPRFTALPLLKSSFSLTKDSSIPLTAPSRVNVQAPFPLFPLR